MDLCEEDYYQHALIKPPKDDTFADNSSKYTRIVIDSRVRNKTLFPKQNDYEIPFEDDINDCYSAKLLYIDLPFPMYLINSNFNKLYFKVGATSYTATIAQGDYSAPADLATAMTTAMNAALPSTFQVTYNSNLDNFKFNANTAFTLVFSNVSNPLNQLLGFSDKDYTSVADPSTPAYANLVASEFRKNYEYNNYIIMDIDQFDLLKSIDRDLNKSFAIIPKNYSTLNICDEFAIEKFFSPPIARMTKLRVRFYDRFGNPYDFQNMDHRFEILVTSFKQRRKYLR